jgi:uncharacterized protein (TIGR00255 family)
MISMTGFGHGEYRDSRVQMVLEIRSYNNRFLELGINLPYALKQFEPRVREYLSSRAQRGKVELYLSLLELEDSSEIVVDHARVKGYLAALDELRKTARRRERPTLAQLINLDGVLKTVSRKDPEALWALVQPLLDKVFAEFDASRNAEGRRTQEDIRKCAADISARMVLIEAKVPRSRTASRRA